MDRKGQVTLFIIVAVVMLAAFGVGFYALISSERADTDPYYTQKFSLDSDTNALNAHVQSCLQEKTLRGIDYYGIKDVSEEMISNYITISMEECVNFPYYEEKGYSVEREWPSSEVKINEDAVISNLEYPITIKKDGMTAYLVNFEFNFPRQKGVQLNDQGQAEEELRLLTDDRDAEFIIPEGTVALDADGNPIKEIKVKVQDRNVYGLDNRVVIGNAVYEGLPSGATFSPALDVKFTIKYGDKPMYMDPEDMMCAYYDEGSDIWRTYRTINVIDNGPSEKTYTVNCLVEHFTLMAVVDCGVKEEVSDYTLSLNPLFQNILEPSAEYTQAGETQTPTGQPPKFWFRNVNSKTPELDRGEEDSNYGIHLIPEKMAEAECNLERTKAEATTHYYSGTAEGVVGDQAEFAVNSDLCIQLLQDWDSDDNTENSNSGYFKYKFLDGSDSTISEDKILDLEGLKEECYKKCAEDARKDILEYIKSWSGKIEGVSPEELITGDGINDHLSPPLRCRLNLKTGTQDIYDSFNSCIKDSPGDISDNIHEHQYQIGDKYSMEYPKTLVGRWASFYATPKTYGYAKSEGAEIAVPDYASLEAAKKTIVLGGYADYEIMFEDKGGACTDAEQDLAEATISSNPEFQSGGGAPISSQEGAEPVTIEGFPDMCDANDACVWTLNEDDEPNRGKLKGGSNIIRVYVSNLAAADALIDPFYFASARINIQGKGLMAIDGCGSSIQGRINQIHKNSGYNSQELNCVAAYRNWLRNRNTDQLSYDESLSTNLCTVDFTDPGFLSFVDPETNSVPPSYCACIKYGTESDWKCPENCNSACTILSPNGGELGAEENACPDILNPDYKGCKCGGVEYDGSNTQYCCKEQLVDESGLRNLLSLGADAPLSVGSCRGADDKVCWCKDNGKDASPQYTNCGFYNTPQLGRITVESSICEGYLDTVETVGCCLHLDEKDAIISCEPDAVQENCPTGRYTLFSDKPCSSDPVCEKIISTASTGCCVKRDNNDNIISCTPNTRESDCSGDAETFYSSPSCTSESIEESCEGKISAEVCYCPTNGATTCTKGTGTAQNCVVSGGSCSMKENGGSCKEGSYACDSSGKLGVCEAKTFGLIQDCTANSAGLITSTAECMCGAARWTSSNTNKYCCDGAIKSSCAKSPEEINCNLVKFCSDYALLARDSINLPAICDQNPCQVVGGCKQMKGGTRCISVELSDACPTTDEVPFEGKPSSYWFDVNSRNCYSCTYSPLERVYNWDSTRLPFCGSCDGGLFHPGTYKLKENLCKLCVGNLGSQEEQGWITATGKCGCPVSSEVNIIGKNGENYYDGAGQCWSCPIGKDAWEKTSNSNCPESKCTLGSTSYTFSDGSYICGEDSYYYKCIRGVSTQQRICDKACEKGTTFNEEDKSVCLN